MATTYFLSSIVPSNLYHATVYATINGSQDLTGQLEVVKTKDCCFAYGGTHQTLTNSSRWHNKGFAAAYGRMLCPVKLSQ
jgi:hypothetical protein